MTVIRNALLPDGRLHDISIVEGRVVEVTPVSSTDEPADGDIDARGLLALPAFVEPHAHLDKAYTADLVPNPTGDLLGAIESWRAHYDDRTRTEIAERARRAAMVAVANGVTAIRSHADVTTEIGLRAVDALLEVRSELHDLVDLQIVALVGRPVAGPAGADHRALLAAAIEAGVDLVGGCPHLEEDGAGLIAHVLETAGDHDLGVDLHVDETLDPSVRTLDLLARAVIDTSFRGRVTASHCVSLGMRAPEDQRVGAELVAEAGISIVTLPQTNLFLQARGVRPGPPRGLTALGALARAGVLVAGGGDNVQDPFNTVGRNDPLETAALLVMAGHLTPTSALRLVSTDARSVLGLEAAGPEPGAIADLVLIGARNDREAVADAPAARIVVRAGRVVATTTSERSWNRSRTDT